MADLTDIQAAQSVKLIGSDLTGAEGTPAKVSANQDLYVSDVSNNGGVEGALTVGTSAVEVKVGGSALANRKLVTLSNNSAATIYWGYTSGVTTTTGTPLLKGQERGWECGPGTSIWVIAGTASLNTRITERA